MARALPFYDLKVSSAARRAVAATLERGWLTSGPAVDQLESRAGDLLGIPNVAGVSSATAGIFLALRTAGVGPGDEVVTTPFSFVAGVEAILNLRATPVLVDIDQGTLNIDPLRVEKSITKKTRAILTVDIAGSPCDYPALAALAKQRRVPLISDSAHALGALVNGKSIAHYCRASVYSLHATKNLTSGEGGLVVSRERQFIRSVRLQAKHGMTASAYERRKSGGWRYDVTTPGFKANLSDVHASLALGELTVFASYQAKRKELAMRYISNLSVAEELVQTPSFRPGFQPAWHLFIAQLNLNRLRVNRNRVIDELAKNKIGCGVHYRPIHTLSFARKAPGIRGRFPVAEKAGQAVMSLPLYPLLSHRDVDRVCDYLVSTLNRYRR